MTERPILYSFRRCPYAMRARMALAIAEIDCEVREVVLRDKPDALLAASPKGTVPVLVTGNETNNERTFGIPNDEPYVKDGIDRAVVHGEADVVAALVALRGQLSRRQE